MIDSSDNRLILTVTSDNQTSVYRPTNIRSSSLGGATSHVDTLNNVSLSSVSCNDNNTTHHSRPAINPCYPFSEVAITDEVIAWYSAVQLQQQQYFTERLAATQADEDSKVMQLTPYYIYFPDLRDELNTHSRHCDNNGLTRTDINIGSSKDMSHTVFPRSQVSKSGDNNGTVPNPAVSNAYSAFVLEGATSCSSDVGDTMHTDSSILSCSTAVIQSNSELRDEFMMKSTKSFDELIKEWTSRPINVIIEEQLRVIPANYKDDTVCEETVDKMLSDLIYEQKLKKKVLNDKFREELHQYQNTSLQVIPSLLSTCDILDDSQEECRSTVMKLRSAKERAANSVMLLGAYRRRNNRRAFLSVLEGVISWQEKFSSVVNQIERKEYAKAAQTLEARLNSVDGYFFKRKEVGCSSGYSSVVTSPKQQFNSQIWEPHSPNGHHYRHLNSTGIVAENITTKTTLYTTGSLDEVNDNGKGPLSEEGVLHVNGDWEARDKGSTNLLFDEFFCGVSSDEMTKLNCGKLVVAQFFELRQCGGLLIGACIRQDVSILLTEGFNCSLLFKALKGLHALHIREKAVSEFFLEIVEFMLFEIIRSSLADIVGDDVGDSWEDIAKNLTPSELHPCTIAMLSKLSAALRNILKVWKACKRLHEECDALLGCFDDKKKRKSAKKSLVTRQLPVLNNGHDNNMIDFFEETTTTEEAKTILEGCKFLSNVGTNSIHLCLAAVANYAQNVNLQRGNVQDALHVYRLLGLFVQMCGSVAPNDQCVESTKIALRLHWESLFAKHFHSKALDEILKIFQNDQFVPFPVNAGDFPEVTPFLEKEDDGTEETFRQYLVLNSQHTMVGISGKLSPGQKYQNDHICGQRVSMSNAVNKVISRTSASSLVISKIEEELRLDVTPNPFSSNLYYLQPTYFSLEPSPDRKPETLFDICPFPLFTFSSYMVCKKIFELVEQCKTQAAAAEDFCELIHHLTCCYLIFIGTHFVASDEMVPLDADETIPPHIQGYAGIIRRYSQKAMSLCDTMVNAGFPYCQNGLCHQWKAHANSHDHMYSAHERCSAVVSLESVAGCHRLCVKALTGILSPKSLSSVVELREAVDGYTKYAVQQGLLQLAVNIVPLEMTAKVIDETSYDGFGVNSNSFFSAFGSVTKKSSTSTSSTLNNGTSSECSPWVSHNIALITRVKNRLHTMYNGGPSIASRKLLDQCIVHIFVSTVEGITRRRKYTETGKATMMRDCENLTKSLKDLHPTLSRVWTEHVLRIARCIVSSVWPEVLQMVKSYHRFYKYRQLMSFGEREGMLKKRELEVMMRDLITPTEDHVIVTLLLDAATAAAMSH